MAAAPGPLACPSRSARPRKARGHNLTLNMYTNLLRKKNGHVQHWYEGGGAGGQKSFSRTDPNFKYPISIYLLNVRQGPEKTSSHIFLTWFYVCSKIGPYYNLFPWLDILSNLNTFQLVIQQNRSLNLDVFTPRLMFKSHLMFWALMTKFISFKI